MIKLLGIIDLISVIVYILIQWQIGVGFAYFIAGYLIIKSLIFLNDWTSWIDLASGIYLILVILDLHSAFSLIFIFWLLQKGIFSLLSF